MTSTQLSESCLRRQALTAMGSSRRNGTWLLRLGSEAKMYMYVITGVPDDTHFEPKTRKEIRVSHVTYFIRPIPILRSYNSVCMSVSVLLALEHSVVSY